MAVGSSVPTAATHSNSLKLSGPICTDCDAKHSSSPAALLTGFNIDEKEETEAKRRSDNEYLHHHLGIDFSSIS